MHEWECCCDENHQLPRAVAVFIVLHTPTMKTTEGVLLVNCLAYRGILWWMTPSQSKNTVNTVSILLWLCHLFFSTTFETFVPHFYLCCTPCIIPKRLLSHLNSFCVEECSSLTLNFDADSLLYLGSHFECNGHTVHMLTQQCLPPPLTSTVRSSLFTHVHSNPLSLAARLHRCHTNRSHYSNNGWTFSRQTSVNKIRSNLFAKPGKTEDSGKPSGS